MFVKVHKPTKGVASNIGTSNVLFDYLSKENSDREYSDEYKFFNHSDEFTKSECIDAIDSNTAQLGKKDAKFYMLTLNPSHAELKEMIKGVTDKEIHFFGELSKDEQAKVNEALQEYTRKCMDLYAKGFNRDNVTSGKDLVYFAMIETQREYKGWEDQVKEGIVKQGQQKEGLNLHVHVVVSRKDATNTVKLSPLAKSAGNSWSVDGQERTRGFNHEVFKQGCIDSFNEKFNYLPMDKETYFNIDRLQARAVTLKSEIEITKQNISRLEAQIEKLNQQKGTLSYSPDVYLETKKNLEAYNSKLKFQTKELESVNRSISFNSRHKNNFDSLSKQTGNKAKQVVNKLQNKVFEDLQNERQALGNVKSAINLISNPKQAIISTIKNKIQSIIELSIENGKF